MAITIRQNCKNFNYTIVTKDTWVNLTTALSLDDYKRNYIFISNGGIGWSYTTTPIVEVWTDISIVPVAQHGQPVLLEIGLKNI